MDRFVELPSYEPEGQDPDRSFFPPMRDSTRAVSDSSPYRWRRVPMGDFAALCLGSILGKRFRDAQDHARWMKLRETNEFVRWEWMDGIAVDSIRKLSSNRRRFLEVAVLTSRFFHDAPFGWMDIDPVPGSATRMFVEVVGIQDSLKALWQTLDEGSVMVGLLTGDTAKPFEDGMGSLLTLAHSLSRDDLLDILDPSSIRRYDSLWRTEDLREYRFLGSLLLATEAERLARDPDTTRVFDLCLGYWNDGYGLEWNLHWRIAELLFRIDAPRARALFAPLFEDVPTRGSSKRDAVLTAMIRHDVKGSRDLIERWYGIVQRLDLHRFPGEARIILDELASGGTEAQALRRKLVRDRRYVAPKGRIIPLRGR
jgi:hypothetical protein